MLDPIVDARRRNSGLVWEMLAHDHAAGDGV